MDNKRISRRKFVAVAAGTAAAGSILGVGGLRWAEASNSVKILVNGQAVNSAGAMIKDGITLVPVRFVAEALGAEVRWDGATQTVSINTGAKGAAAAVNQGTPPDFPWPWAELDPDEVARRGYEFYFSKGACANATFQAIVGLLREKVGYPWTTLPDNLWLHGSGGIVSWGTICGSLNSAAMLIHLATGKDYPVLVDNLFKWYCEYEFPSKRYESYCKFPNQLTTVADSPLCHISVSKWSRAAGVATSSDEKKDRCAKLSGDVAVYTLELINRYRKEGNANFAGTWAPAEAFSHCRGCHTTSSVDIGPSQQGKLNCVPCHGDHTK